MTVIAPHAEVAAPQAVDLASAGLPWLSEGAISVLGTGSALPGPPLSTERLLDQLGPWLGASERNRASAVAAKLGIATRHSSRPWSTRLAPPSPGCSNPELAARAVRAALTEAGVSIWDVGYLIGHTATPAQPMPGNIAFVADLLGYSGPHIELRQACTGFANALMIAFGLLARPDAKPVVIVGSETGSAFLDPERLNIDPSQIINLVQMGDGAGAILLGPARRGSERLHSAWYGAMGLHRSPAIELRGDTALASATGSGPLQFRHDFRAILATGRTLFTAGAAAAAAHGFDLAYADIVIPHQVSGRIGQQVAEHFDIPVEHVFVNADAVGNTGSAAIWIALHELRGAGVWPGHAAVVLGAEATKFMHGGFVLAA